MKIILLFVGLLCGFASQAQKFSYTYDFAGNRISRTVVTLKTKEDLLPQTEEETEITENITVYPNPTTGTVNIRFTNYEPEKSGIIRLYNASGVLLQTKKSLNTENEINLENYPAGTYIIKISTEKIDNEFLIIKQ